MDLIYDFPQANGPGADFLGVGSVGEVSMALERSGWFGLAFTEHPAPSAKWLAAGGHQSLDPFIALSHAAAVTERIRLLTYLAVAPYRNPLMLAKAAASVDVLSAGRLILGLGTGYLKSEFRALGVDFEHRNVLFDQTLDVLPLHWSGEPFDYEGTGFSARDIQAQPAAIQQPIPVWIGGNARVTRERVAQRAQGWMPLPGTPEQTAFTRTPAIDGMADLAAKIDGIKSAAADRRDAMSPELLEFVYVYQDRTLWSAPDADTDRHRDALAQLTSAGITKIVLNGPMGASAAENLDWIATIGSIYS